MHSATPDNRIIPANHRRNHSVIRKACLDLSSSFPEDTKFGFGQAELDKMQIFVKT